MADEKQLKELSEKVNALTEANEKIGEAIANAVTEAVKPLVEAQEWNNTITARRNRWTTPSIRDLLMKLDAMGAMPAGWSMHWDDLSDDTPTKRLDRAYKMADINQKMGDDVYEIDEIRAETGHDDLSVE